MFWCWVAVAYLVGGMSGAILMSLLAVSKVTEAQRLTDAWRHEVLKKRGLPDDDDIAGG